MIYTVTLIYNKISGGKYKRLTYITCVFDSEYCVLLEVKGLCGKKYGNTHTCMHIMMNTHILILGSQNDIQMSSMLVIKVNSIFTWFPEIAIMKLLIIKPCKDVPCKHCGCCHDFHFHSPDRQFSHI